jgi:hypothetical protein
MTGHASCFQAAATSPRSADRRAGTWTLHPMRCSRTSVPVGVYSTKDRRRTRSAIRARVRYWFSSPPHAAGPASSAASSSASWATVSLHSAPWAPLVARGPGRQRLPPVGRHPLHPQPPRDFPVGRAGLDPVSGLRARTRSRRARSAAVSPPPSGYLMTPAYNETVAGVVAAQSAGHRNRSRRSGPPVINVPVSALT